MFDSYLNEHKGRIDWPWYNLLHPIKFWFIQVLLNFQPPGRTCASVTFQVKIYVMWIKSTIKCWFRQDILWAIPATTMTLGFYAYIVLVQRKKKTYPCAVNQLKGKTLRQNVHLGCYSINGGLSRTLEAYLLRWMQYTTETILGKTKPKLPQ